MPSGIFCLPRRWHAVLLAFFASGFAVAATAATLDTKLGWESIAETTPEPAADEEHLTAATVALTAASPLAPEGSDAGWSLEMVGAKALGGDERRAARTTLGLDLRVASQRAQSATHFGGTLAYDNFEIQNSLAEQRDLQYLDAARRQRRREIQGGESVGFDLTNRDQIRFDAYGNAGWHDRLTRSRFGAVTWTSERAARWRLGLAAKAYAQISGATRNSTYGPELRAEHALDARWTMLVKGGEVLARTTTRGAPAETSRTASGSAELRFTDPRTTAVFSFDRAAASSDDGANLLAVDRAQISLAHQVINRQALRVSTSDARTAALTAKGAAPNPLDTSHASMWRAAYVFGIGAERTWNNGKFDAECESSYEEERLEQRGAGTAARRTVAFALGRAF